MKKLLILVLVLGMASLAKAGPWGWSAITSPMQIVDNLDGTYAIELTSGMTVANDGPSGGYWALVGVDSTTGSLAATLPSFLDASAVQLADSTYIGLAAGEIGEFATTSPATNWTTASGVYATGFTALPGVTELDLWQLNDYSPVQIVNTLIVPEPATILLLTLGGLALRKHRR